jgi:hypothetical protein
MRAALFAEKVGGRSKNRTLRHRAKAYHRFETVKLHICQLFLYSQHMTAMAKRSIEIGELFLFPNTV